jgi:hypothetical protein
MREAILGILLFSFTACYSQESRTDTIPRGNLADTVAADTRPVEPIESYATRFDPRKALFYSAVMPGLGQIYNKKYWKLPFVYGGFGALIYVDHFYHTEYKKYTDDLFDIINDPSSGGVSPDGLTEEQLRTLINKARRQRDFFIIMTGMFYLLQIVDAHVDAHLKEFDLNPKLQVSIEPMMENSLQMGRSTGMALIFKF